MPWLPSSSCSLRRSTGVVPHDLMLTLIRRHLVRRRLKVALVDTERFH